MLKFQNGKFQRGREILYTVKKKTLFQFIDFAQKIKSEGLSCKFFNKTGIFDFHQKLIIFDGVEVKAIAERRKTGPNQGYEKAFHKGNALKIHPSEINPCFFLRLSGYRRVSLGIIETF